MNLKVLSDDGFILTLMRPCESYKLRRGLTVDIKELKEPVDLNRMFESVITDDLVQAILERVSDNAVVRKSKANK